MLGIVVESTAPRMSLLFRSDIIAVYRPTNKEYDFLKFDADPQRLQRWGTIEPPVIEGICAHYPHTFVGHTNILDFWNAVGYKRLHFTIHDTVIKGHDRLIPVIRLSNGVWYTNPNTRIKKADIAAIVIPPGQQIADIEQPEPVPVPQGPIRTPIIVPSNLPKSMFQNVRGVAESMDVILTNEAISLQEKSSRIMTKFARSIREVIRTVEVEKGLPQFVAQLVAQRSIEHGDVCPITCDHVTLADAAVTSCFHVFSKGSIQEYRAGGNMTCPVCRQYCAVTNTL